MCFDRVSVGKLNVDNKSSVTIKSDHRFRRTPAHAFVITDAPLHSHMHVKPMHSLQCCKRTRKYAPFAFEVTFTYVPFQISRLQLKTKNTQAQNTIHAINQLFGSAGSCEFVQIYARCCILFI